MKRIGRGVYKGVFSATILNQMKQRIQKYKSGTSNPAPDTTDLDDVPDRASEDGKGIKDKDTEEGVENPIKASDTWTCIKGVLQRNRVERAQKKGNYAKDIAINIQDHMFLA